MWREKKLNLGINMWCKNKQNWLLIFVASAAMAFVQPAWAESDSINATENVSVVGMIECSSGGTLDQYFCFSEKLDKREKEMNDAIKKSISSINNEWGAEATKEIRERMQSTQEVWIKYRDGQCIQDYYTKAEIHPPSQSLSATECKLSKTNERIQEIKSGLIK